jgi:hypothetical protein
MFNVLIYGSWSVEGLGSVFNQRFFFNFTVSIHPPMGSIETSRFLDAFCYSTTWKVNRNEEK